MAQPPYQPQGYGGPGPQGGGYPPQGGGYPPPGHQGGGYHAPGHQGGGYPPPGHQGGGYPPPGHQGGGFPPQGPQGGGLPPGHPPGAGYPGPGYGGGGHHPGGPPGGPPMGPPMGPTMGPPGPGTPWQPGQGGPHQWDNLPQKPLDDNPSAEPPPFQPPSIDGFQRYNGYEGVAGFGGMAPLPPPPPPPLPSGTAPPMEFDSFTKMTDEECREALLEYVSQHCCFGKGAAKEMEVTEVEPSTALHYTLETFSESRKTGYAHEPYRGGPVDGPNNGQPPPPWDIPCNPKNHFSPHEFKFEVPHTSNVQQCSGCYGRGFLRCHRCHGMGHVRCSHCLGDGRVTRTDAEGHRHTENCHTCGGDGRKRCLTCHGDGRVRCHTCEGFGQLRCYIQLTVTFINHVNDHIIEKTDMPDKLVRGVTGEQIFEQVLPQVWPIVAFPVQDINDNSQRLVHEHHKSWQDERKLNQRHRLRAVPVTEVHFKFKDTKTRFWIYGKERQVYAPDYPQQCCCGCTIL